jgi:hypothetical protein
VLDLAGSTVADLLHVRVDSAAFQRGEGELTRDEDEGAYGERGQPEQAPEWAPEQIPDAAQDVHHIACGSGEVGQPGPEPGHLQPGVDAAGTEFVTLLAGEGSA